MYFMKWCIFDVVCTAFNPYVTYTVEWVLNNNLIWLLLLFVWAWLCLLLIVLYIELWASFWLVFWRRLGLVVFAIDCIVHRTVSELLTCLLTTCFSPWCGINCERVIGPEMTLWGWRDVKTTTRSPENVFEYDCIDFCWMFLNMIVLTSAGYFWIWLYWLLLGLVRPEVDRTLKSKSNYQLCVCLICIIT